MEEIELGERRQFRRAKYSEPVQFQFKDPSHFGGCLSCDISEGGLKVNLNEFVPLKTELMLQLQLSDSNVVELVGKVVWVEKLPYSDRFQVGLEFEETDSIVETKRKIHQSLGSNRT